MRFFPPPMASLSPRRAPPSTNVSRLARARVSLAPPPPPSHRFSVSRSRAHPPSLRREHPYSVPESSITIIMTSARHPSSACRHPASARRGSVYTRVCVPPPSPRVTIACTRPHRLRARPTDRRDRPTARPTDRGVRRRRRRARRRRREETRARRRRRREETRAFESVGASRRARRASRAFIHSFIHSRADARARAGRVRAARHVDDDDDARTRGDV